jgi:erythronate-4-phosphate dehydrogenase
VGNVGSKVAVKAAALGMRVVLHDPPLAAQSGDAKYRPIDEILACDVITFHVPLERGGAYPTRHLCDSAFLAAMKPDAILFNTSRGAVVDNAALKAALSEGLVRGAVLDVWEGEPRVDVELLQLVEIASPHIAGYSFDGKVNGTVQIYRAACAHFGLAAPWDPASLLPAADCPDLTLDPDAQGEVARCVRAVYDILEDDARMRVTSTLDDAERGPYFDRLRKEYPRRREFHNTRVHTATPDGPDATTLRGLGFQITD